MKIIGLTGPSGAGKGEFGKVCQGFPGIVCLDTDKTARKVVEKGQPCLNELCCYFGDILKEDGTLDRAKLASLAFADPKKHRMLNFVTHRYITKEVKSWISHMETCGETLAIIDAPLLFESGLDRVCDLTICITSPYSERLARIMDRDGIDEKAAKLRLDSQKSNEYYIEKCDYSIVNDKDIDDFYSQSKEVIKEIMSR